MAEQTIQQLKPESITSDVYIIAPTQIEYIAHIFECVPKISAAEGLVNGYRLISNCGADACQSVTHLHFHILGGRQLPENMG